MSIIKTASADELVKIADRGEISDSLRARVIETLEVGVGPLADFQRQAILKNLTPQTVRDRLDQTSPSATKPGGK